MGRNRSNATAPAVKGNLVAGTGVDTSGLLTVGANDTVLTADSSTATGLKWATPASGGMTLISTTTLSGTSTTISSIPTGYKNLLVLLQNVQCNGLGDPMWIRINGISDASTYAYGLIRSSSGVLSAAQINASGNRGYFGYSVNNSTNFRKQQASITIYESSSTGTKYIQTLNGGFSSSNDMEQTTGWCGHLSTAAVTSLVIGVDGGLTFTTGSVLLYGVS